MEFTKPSIIRLARRAGVKSMSEDTFCLIQEIINLKTKELVNTALIINAEKNTKTLMKQDIYDAFLLLGENIAFSTDLK
jgi:histone H3/H4